MGAPFDLRSVAVKFPHPQAPHPQPLSREGRGVQEWVPPYEDCFAAFRASDEEMCAIGSQACAPLFRCAANSSAPTWAVECVPFRDGTPIDVAQLACERSSRAVARRGVEAVAEEAATR